ncbi:Domain of unknown function DUF4149 [Methylophilaceae bacterium]
MLSMYLVAGIVGVMLFFSVAVAPTIFKVLPQEWASAYVRQFFPKYYFVLGFSCIVSGIFAQSLQLKVITFICAVLFAISLWLLTPAVNKAKDENNLKKFNVLHGLSVTINMVILLALIYCFWIN